MIAANSEGVAALQWSHGLAAVETGPSPACAGASEPASMEPRPCSRGNVGAADAGDDGADASMEPRPCSRGNRGRGRGRRDDRRASMEPRPCSRGNAAPTPPPRATARRFNGATALQPWKRDDRRELGRVRLASMEPRPCSRGNPPGATGHVPLAPASMEPRPCSRGNTSSRTRGTRSPRRFNGATALQPWKPGHRERAPSLPLQASMEPRPCSRGNERAVKRASR